MMRKALFLDRDGVLNRERGSYTFQPADFELLPDVVAALKKAKSKGYMLIVISNQGGIAKGIYSKKEVETLHESMKVHLRDAGVEIDEIYYCPHHPEHGKCLCRKPQPLMLQKALARFGIDASRSWMIGDGQRDVEAASAAGVKGIKIESNSGILEICENLP